MKRFAVTAALAVSAVLVIAQPALASWQQQNTPTPPGSNPIGSSDNAGFAGAINAPAT